MSIVLNLQRNWDFLLMDEMTAEIFEKSYNTVAMKVKSCFKFYSSYLYCS